MGDDVLSSKVFQAGTTRFSALLARNIPDGPTLIDLSSQRHAVPTGYRIALDHAHTDTDPVLRGLLDTHLRLTGNASSAEATSWRLARATAIAHTHREAA
ncbi:hypothetical protein ACFRQM_26905 [Streptomyces sp. NPDC056831]|uniref:hypothetical protein n=1 Tax=Streptomyces sp. NPDC056831 TaxID=3345954 RepID=UPI0036B6FAA0